jgi:integrase
LSVNLTANDHQWSLVMAVNMANTYDDAVARREYGSGSIYQRKRDKRWVGTLEAGWNSDGTRKRIAVTGKTKAVVQRKLRDKAAELKAGEIALSSRATVKAWADEWLPIKQRSLSPNGYKALRSPIMTWVIPTIGHKRLSSLTPADVRAVETRQRDAGKKGTTCAATQRALFNMLRAAIAEGHTVPQRVLLSKTPDTSPSDRKPLSLPEALAVLAEASELPHGTRWAVALLTGMRQGECLGLTWDAIDFDAGEIVVEWQLQRLNYKDPKNKALGFKVPDEYDARQVHKSVHLVRPKSKAGFRTYPLLPPVADALRSWRMVAPENPAGLVWPTPDGKPRASLADLEEWHDLQDCAGVRHPAGRHYHVHECRNVTATELRNLGADDLVITSLLGHTSIGTSRGYMAIDREAKTKALEGIARALQIG